MHRTRLKVEYSNSFEVILDFNILTGSLNWTELVSLKLHGHTKFNRSCSVLLKLDLKASLCIPQPRK